MKFFRNIRRYFRDAMKSVIRNFSLSLASISCIAITLIVVGISIVLSYNVENMTDSIKKDVTMVVFLKPDTTEDEVKDIQKKITNMGNIEEIKFKSKKEYAEETKERDEVFSFIVDNWTDETNPLLDSFLIKVKEVEEIKNTASSIKKIDKVELVNYGEDMVNQLITVFDVIRKVSIGAVVALILVTAFLIANTIKLAIFSRKTEIEIMRLVGASNISIKIPFIIEGSFIGILGSIIPIILMIYGYTSLYNYFDGKLSAGAVADFSDQYVYDRYSRLPALADAEQKPDRGPLYHEHSDTGPACGADRLLDGRNTRRLRPGICGRLGRYFDRCHRTARHCRFYDSLPDQQAAQLDALDDPDRLDYCLHFLQYLSEPAVRHF